ncbi:unnamed protein product [Soboliphyme baturini]|uniref:Nudix hydrolase domain-containing protein n=1 Tax=Soboliphyme baturini TaxID=241478 RepID=A0A183IH09_9BILA|nr:unnamed protein product [Soboliphyme baturini]
MFTDARRWRPVRCTMATLRCAPRLRLTPHCLSVPAVVQQSPSSLQVLTFAEAGHGVRCNFSSDRQRPLLKTMAATTMRKHTGFRLLVVYINEQAQRVGISQSSDARFVASKRGRRLTGYDIIDFAEAKTLHVYLRSAICHLPCWSLQRLWQRHRSAGGIAIVAVVAVAVAVDHRSLIWSQKRFVLFLLHVGGRPVDMFAAAAVTATISHVGPVLDCFIVGHRSIDHTRIKIWHDMFTKAAQRFTAHADHSSVEGRPLLASPQSCRRHRFVVQLQFSSKHVLATDRPTGWPENWLLPHYPLKCKQRLDPSLVDSQMQAVEEIHFLANLLVNE